MSDLPKGCNRWLGLLEQGNQATERRQQQYFYHLAYEHQKDCETCQRMNMPLVELLFNQKVIVAK